MNCRWVESRLAAYADAELGGEEMLRVRQHLNRCGSCESLHSEHLTVKRIAGGIASAEPPTTLLEGIIARLDGAEASGTRSLWLRLGRWLRAAGLDSAYAWRRAALGAAGILVALVAASNVLSTRDSGTPKKASIDYGLDFTDTQHTFYQSSQPLGMEAGFVLMEAGPTANRRYGEAQPATATELSEDR